jgi:ATPase family associated with various cellular activities (AAA)
MPTPNLQRLRQLVDRADILLQHDFAYLSGYWNPKKCGFHANEASISSGYVNVTTTCFCLFAALRNPAMLSRFPLDTAGTVDGSMPTRVANTLLCIPWTSERLPENNPYTAPIAIRTLYRLLEPPVQVPAVLELLTKPESKSKLTAAFQAVLKATEDGAAHVEPYSASAYLTYWSYRALRSESEHELLDLCLTARCAKRADTIARWAEGEIHRQIAYDAAQDTASFDATQLTYAVRIYAQNSGTSKKPLNQKLVAKAIEVIASQQMPDGLWPKAHPLFHYKTRGNVYTFTFEMLDVIITQWLPAELFWPFVDKLEASLRWAEQNRIEGARTSGWRSNHLPFGSEAEAWSTAAVLIAVWKIRTIVSRNLNDEILNEFRAKRFALRDDAPLGENRFYDCEVPHSPPKSLKETLRKYLILPHRPDGKKDERRYSAVFFGPPGTAKTTLAEAIARGLGWSYVYLQTSDFAGEMNQVIGKARDVFTRLALLDQAVILFDEVEEFVRDRDREESPQSRMLTTSMLSLIQDLRGHKKVIFIVATNFLDKFDAAITRPGGRFDLMILVAPPSRSEKERMFRDQLKKTMLKARETEVCTAFNTFVEKNYDAEFSFLPSPNGILSSQKHSVRPSKRIQWIRTGWKNSWTATRKGSRSGEIFGSLI